MKKDVIKLLIGLALIVPCFAGSSAFNVTSVDAAEKSNSITLSNLEKVDNTFYKMPVTIAGSLKVYSISITDGSFQLTSVSGNGYKFKNANGSLTPSTNTNYNSVTLEVSADSASLNTTAKAALESIRYNSVSNKTVIKISADTALLASGDYYFNGHYYTLSTFHDKSWAYGMQWAYNLQSTDATRKFAYAGYISYPLMIESVNENTFINTYIASASRFVFLAAVPVTCNAGSISVSGDDGNKTVTVVGEPKVSTNLDGVYGRGDYWKWLHKTGSSYTDSQTTSAGESLLPNESSKVSKTVNGDYWCYDNPTNGGMVYTPHPSVPGKWDDLAIGGSWGDNVWTSPITGQFANKMYALAEWESGGDTTASAEWKASEPSLNITYDVQGHGTAPASSTTSFDSKITAPTEPTEDGYMFVGWYKEAACTNLWDFDNDTVIKDTTLYAKWVEAETNTLGGWCYDSGKKGLVAFGITYSDYANLTDSDTFGFCIYSSSSGGTPSTTLTSTKISDLKTNEGRFYFYRTCDNGVTFYAKAFVKIGGNTYYSSMLTATGNTSGQEYTLPSA